MLDEAIKHLEAQSKAFSYEILLVSDGSRDKTVLVAQGYGKTIGPNKLRVLDLEANRGKGGAVRLVCYSVISPKCHFYSVLIFTGNAKRPWKIFVVCRR